MHFFVIFLCEKFAGMIFCATFASQNETEREFSSAGLEHLPYKQRVGGSNPSTPTRAKQKCKATRKSGFCFSEHYRACTEQCSEITKDAVQITAFLLHIAEDSKGKALSEADARLRSSQSRSDRHILPSRRSERRASAKLITP